MSTQHTPGPWIVDGKRIRTVAIKFPGAETGATVAQVDKGAVGYSQATANARLIAAAPDLLDALRDIVNNIDDGQLLAHWGDGQSVNIDSARAAIAKATKE